jgi:hypothetical protein
MHWTGWIVVALALLNGGYMVYDGSRALIVGDFITPSSGDYAGQLGPWSRLAEAVGIPPRSTLMKLVFVGYGILSLAMAVSFSLRLPWAWWGMLIVAILGLWNLIFGTAVNLVMIVLLLLPVVRSTYFG